MTKRLGPCLVGIVLLLAGCGHRGNPRPPLRKTPPVPGEFRVAQRGSAIELAALAPAASIDGVPYQSLRLEFLHTTGQGDIEKTGARLDTTVPAGGRGAVTLPLPVAGTSLRAVVRAIVGGDKGAKTPTTALRAWPEVQAPSGLVATLGEDGVALAWHGPRPEPLPTPSPSPTPGGVPAGARATPAVPVTKPKEGATPAAPAPVATAAPAPAATAASAPRSNGFLVYRRVGSEGYLAPLEAEPLERRSFGDAAVPLGASVCYVVRAAASTNPLVESAASNEACLETRDVAAPATPTGLVVVPRQGGLQLLWSPSREEDLAGYRVYRATDGGQPSRLAELPAAEASFVDTTAEKGRRYSYALSAFDRAGNESPPGEPVDATAP